MSKIALIECVKMPKIVLIYFQRYTTVSNTDLYLSYNDLYPSYFDLSYVFSAHNDSIKRGLTVLNLSINLSC